MFLLILLRSLIKWPAVTSAHAFLCNWTASNMHQIFVLFVSGVIALNSPLNCTLSIVYQFPLIFSKGILPLLVPFTNIDTFLLLESHTVSMRSLSRLGQICQLLGEESVIIFFPSVLIFSGPWQPFDLYSIVPHFHKSFHKWVCQ